MKWLLTLITLLWFSSLACAAVRQGTNPNSSTFKADNGDTNYILQTPATDGVSWDILTYTFQAATVTVLATTATIFTYDLSTSSDSVVVEAHIWCKSMSGAQKGNLGYYIIRGSARNKDGVVAETSAEVASSIFESHANDNVYADTSGTLYRLNVVGDVTANSSLNWYSCIYVHYFRD